MRVLIKLLLQNYLQYQYTFESDINLVVILFNWINRLLITLL